MKEIILTVDYELFFGDKTGSAAECMIEPTKKLLEILENYDSKMTLFWDILHFYKLLELEENYLELKNDRMLIEEQIISIIKKGHDIQLHLHPHWLDAKYEDRKWIFNYDRFKLHDLSDQNNPEDINTISGCVTMSKKLIESIIKKENPNYNLTTFRAGGYLLEPFNKISNALQSNNIKIDSSICSGLFSKDGKYSYNFNNYCNALKFNFESTPGIINNKGSFLEIPITTIKLSRIKYLYFKIFKRIKYPTLENERKGIRAGTNSRSKRLFSYLFLQPNCQLTLDSNFREKFNYLYKKMPEAATMILHSKLLNEHTLGILDEYLSAKKIHFISISQFTN